ncbi:unnamed protein product [Rotaria sordida]|uniref:Uncharacterized protein n=1 Tax=Rotaria sordida TaxID=392033 RepID=A0A815LKB2_9BILA|nr:unnamed protein product [Rotaria sordida]
MYLSPPSPHNHYQHRHRHHSSSSHNKDSTENDQQRTNYIIDTFLKSFTNDIRENPKAWRNRFRKMAANEFSFYRGSAVLFYRDMLYDSKYDPWLKKSTQSAVSSVIQDQNLQYYFRHDGLRTVLCAYAMHAVSSQWLGYATLNNQIPLVVDKVTTHNKNLEWNNINDFEDTCVTVEYLGKAMAKIHCISDIDSIEKEKHAGQHTDLLPLHIIPRHTEKTIRKAIGGNDEGFIQDMISFAMTYGNRVRRDHRLFFEAFRNGRIPMLQVDESHSQPYSGSP